MSPERVAAFFQRFSKLQRGYSAATAVLDSTKEKIGAMKSVLARTTMHAPDLHHRLKTLKDELYDIKNAMDGHQIKDDLGEPRQAAISDRIGNVLIGNIFSTYGPTVTHLRSFEIAVEELGQVRSRLHTITDEILPELEAKLEAAGAP